MPEYRYLHYDVFTDARFEGNPLAVLPDARGLSTEQMQTIAQEMAFSETTFVLPRERDDTDIRMRIFTPAAELPMAGHPTIGSTFALAREGLIRPGAERFVFGLGVGPTPVDLSWDGEALSFAWMTQRAPEFGDTFDDRARAKKRPKHGGDRDRLELEINCPANHETPDRLLAIDEALDSASALGTISPTTTWR